MCVSDSLLVTQVFFNLLLITFLYIATGLGLFLIYIQLQKVLMHTKILKVSKTKQRWTVLNIFMDKNNKDYKRYFHPGSFHHYFPTVREVRSCQQLQVVLDRLTFEVDGISQVLTGELQPISPAIGLLHLRRSGSGCYGVK